MNRRLRKVTLFKSLPTLILLAFFLLPATPSFSGNVLSVDTIQGTSFSLYYDYISSNGRELWFGSDPSMNSTISSTPFIVFGNLHGCEFDSEGNLLVTDTQEFAFDVFAISVANQKITLKSTPPTGPTFNVPKNNLKNLVLGNFSWNSPPASIDTTIVFEASMGLSKTAKKVQRSLTIIKQSESQSSSAGSQTSVNTLADCQGQADKLCYRGDLYINPYGGVHVLADQDGSSVASDVHPIEINFNGLGGGTQPNPPYNTLVVSKGQTLSFNVTASDSGSSGQTLTLKHFSLPEGAEFVDPKPSKGGQLTAGFQWATTASGTYTAIFGAFFGSGTAVLNPTLLVLNINVTEEPPPIIGVDNTSLSFNGTIGGPNPSSQTLSINNAGGGTLNWTATKTQSWLTINPASGSSTGPGNPSPVTVSIDLSGLSAGTYNDTITLSGGNSVPQKTISVTLTLTDQPPTMEVVPKNLTFSATVGGSNPNDQTLTVKNTGGGSLDWTAQKTKSWVVLGTPNPTGPLAAGKSSVISVSISISDPELTSPGTYSDNITISAPAINSSQIVSVSAAMAPNATTPPKISTDAAGSPPTISFSGQVGTSIAAKSLTVSNIGGGSLNWTASKTTSWLNLGTPNPPGAMSTGQSSTITVSININDSALANPGTYSDTIAISDPGASNTPVYVSVTLTLTGNVSPPKIGIDPSTLAFSFNAAVGSTPSPQTLTVINTGGGTLNWSAQAFGSWFNLSPSSGSLSAGSSASINISVVTAGLSANTYNGSITITHNGTNTSSPLTIQVTLTLTGIVVIPPRIGIDPSTLAFSAPVESNPNAKNLTVVNTGGGTLSWSATNSQSWLTLSKTSGALAAGLSDLITVSVNTSGLTTPQTYTDTIIISANGASNTPLNVSVTLTLTSNTPALGISPNNLSFNFVEGSTSPVKQTFYVQNLGGGNLSWSLSFTNPTTQPAWIQSISSTGGTIGSLGSTPIDIFVLTSQPAGFSDSASITVDGGAAGSKTLTVALTVVAPQPATLGLAPQLGLYLRLPAISGGYQGSTVLYVWNQGSGTINWQITNTGSAPWLTFSAIPGSSSNDSEPQSGLPVRSRVSIPFNTNGVPVGDYSTTIRVTQTGTTIAYDIPVYLHIFDPSTPKAILYVTPPPVISSMDYGDPGPSIPLMMWVYNDGQSTLNWRISKIDYNNSQYTSWLSPTSSSGNVPPVTIGNRSYSALSLTLNPKGMPVGTYDATVVFEDPNAVGSPFFAYVIFKIHNKGWDNPKDPVGQLFIPANSTIKPLDGFPNNLPYAQRGDWASVPANGTIYYSIDGSFSNLPYIALNTNFLGVEVPGYLDVIKDGMSGWQRALGTTTLDNITVPNDPLSNKRWYMRFQFGNTGSGLWTYWSPYSN